jgi:hypothetical protein
MFFDQFHNNLKQPSQARKNQHEKQMIEGKQLR